VARVVVAPDKFKGSLTAAQVASALAAGLVSARPGLEVDTVPVADGGDGTVAAAVAAGYAETFVDVVGPTGRPVRASYARRGTDAVVELAAASGLVLVDRPDPLGATSYGTGELVRAALDAGCRRIVLGIGGSACTDGGAGLLQALGARLLDASGNDLPSGGGALASLAEVDLSGLHPAVAEAELVVACDVDNPLIDAATVYGPQKGATADDVAVLERGLRRWAEVVAPAVADVPGAGAAGGAGFAALAVLGATLRPGIDLVLDLVGLDRRLAGAELVITGEGSLDEQTLRGKAPAGVAAAARRAGITVVAAGGRCLLNATELGVDATYALTDLEPDVQRCIEQAAPLLERLGARIASERLTNP
jgi:glycerate 2-kinase